MQLRSHAAVVVRSCTHSERASQPCGARRAPGGRCQSVLMARVCRRGASERRRRRSGTQSTAAPTGGRRSRAGGPRAALRAPGSVQSGRRTARQPGALPWWLMRRGNEWTAASCSPLAGLSYKQRDVASFGASCQTQEAPDIGQAHLSLQCTQLFGGLQRSARSSVFSFTRSCARCSRLRTQRVKEVQSLHRTPHHGSNSQCTHSSPPPTPR